jgi:DNA repair exonuclease SbcCD ATPase subunit
MERRNREPDTTDNNSADKESSSHNRMLWDRVQSSPSEISKDVASSFHKDILQEAMDRSKEYTARKQQLENAEKLLLEFESNFIKKKVKQKKIEDSIENIKKEIKELTANFDKMTEGVYIFQNELKELEEKYNSLQADLQAKQKEIANFGPQFKEIHSKLAEQKKKCQELESFRKTVLALKESRPIDDILSQNVVTSLDAVFNPTQFSLKEGSELQRLGHIYKERIELAKKVSQHVEACQELREMFQEREDFVSSQTQDIDPEKAVIDTEHSNIIEVSSNDHVTQSNTQDVNVTLNQKISAITNKFKLKCPERLPNIENDEKFNTLTRRKFELITSKNDNDKVLETYELEEKLLTVDAQLISHFFSKMREKSSELENLEKEIKENLPELENLEQKIINGENSIDVILETKNLCEEGSKLFEKNRDLLERMKEQPIEHLVPDLNKMIKEKDAHLERLSSSQQLLSNAPLRQEILKDIEEANSIYDTALSAIKTMNKAKIITNFAAIVSTIHIISIIQEMTFHTPYSNSAFISILATSLAYSIKNVSKYIASRTLKTAKNLFIPHESQVKEYKSQAEQYKSQLKVLNQLSECTAALKTYQNYLAEALHEHKASTERFKQLDGFIFNKSKKIIGTEENLSTIDKDLASYKKELDHLNNEYIFYNKINFKLQKEINHIERELSTNERNMEKQRTKFIADQRRLNLNKGIIQEKICDKNKQLEEMTRGKEKNSKELKTLESEVEAAHQRVDAARQQMEQAKKELAQKLVTRMGDLLGNDPISSTDRLGPGNAKKYRQKWANLEPITHPQTRDAIDLRNNESIKASQTILDRLAKVPRDHSQIFFWMRYASLIDRTIEAYTNPQPEGAGKRLEDALKKLNQANDLANEFLDVMYDKEQKASSGQGQV